MEHDKLYRYAESFTRYKRFPSCPVGIGQLTMGGQNPIRLQSMANTDTNNLEASLYQGIRMIDAGAELIRYTAQGIRQVEGLREIKSLLNKKGHTVPIVADIHFNPKAAEMAAKYIEKVRVNPGNYADKRENKGAKLDNKEYKQELERVHRRVKPLLEACKEHGTAIRVGVNHGSLSGRIMDRYGDTPGGMVESAMEFLHLCQAENFYKVVVSMKSSNTRVMVQAARLLAYRMREEGLLFPIHLGVTEAGEGEDGRIKSAVGIGALLNDGIGDTIRVSLTEDPEKELPVARIMIDYIKERENSGPVIGKDELYYNPFDYKKRQGTKVGSMGGDSPPAVILDIRQHTIDFKLVQNLPEAEFYYLGKNKPSLPLPGKLAFIIDREAWRPSDQNIYPLYRLPDYIQTKQEHPELNFVELRYPDLLEQNLNRLKYWKKAVLVLNTSHQNGYAEQRAFFNHLLLNKIHLPVIVKREYLGIPEKVLQVRAAMDTGPLFIDGLGDGLWLVGDKPIESQAMARFAFGILQASRARMSKTEFISCPGCGRTLFDLQQTVTRVKARTRHLKGLKIAVMGCIVNGPGEMADADYGYVGAGPGKVHLYKNKEAVKKNIPEAEAVEELVELIKREGDWRD